MFIKISSFDLSSVYMMHTFTLLSLIAEAKEKLSSSSTQHVQFDVLTSKQMCSCRNKYTISVSLTRGQHTALLRISSLLGEALASTTSLPASLEMTGFSTMVACSSHCP